MASNHGEIVHQWCLDGQGIALRSYWDVKDNIHSGKLVHILPEYFQSANIWAVYVTRLAMSAKVRVSVEFYVAILMSTTAQKIHLQMAER